MRPNILIADDHSMIRKGIKLLIQSHFNISEMDESNSCAETMMKLKKHPFSHLILDIILADGSTLEVLPVIQKLYPRLHIMIFSMQPAEVYGRALKNYGIVYYLPKGLPRMRQ